MTSNSSKKIYLTPNVLFAFVDRTHTQHEQASAYFRYFAEQGYQLYIDIINMYEAYQQISENISPSIGKDYLRTVLLSNVTVIYPDENDTKAATKIFLGNRASEFSFRQALMNVLADKRRIPQLCTLEYVPTMFGLSVFYLPV